MKITKTLILLLALLLANTYTAQSDYEYVQQFKHEIQVIRNTVDKANSFEEIGKARRKIKIFIKKYYPQKDFLNKAVYPESFENIINELNSSLEKRKRMLAETEKTEKKIKRLNDEIAGLSESYLGLLDELETLKLKHQKLLNENSDYQKKIQALKQNIAARDSMLEKTLSALLGVTERELGLKNDTEKRIIRINENTFLAELKRLIRDNILYLEYSYPSEKEIFEIYDEHQTLKNNISRLSPELLSNVLSETDIEGELKQLKSLNDSWGEKIVQTIAGLIGKDFAQFGINLSDSTDVQTLFGSLLDYIEKESVKAGNKYERQHKFKTFSESAWNGIFKRKWANPLLQRGLITTEQIAAADYLVNQWQDRINKTPPYFLYIMVTVIVMFITIYVGAKAKKSKFKRKAKAQKKKNEYDKRKREREIEEYRKKITKNDTNNSK